MADLSKFRAAMRASDLTLQQASDLASISKPTLISRQDDPLQFRLYELKSIYDGMNETGQSLILDAVNEIFLDSELRYTQSSQPA